MASGFLVSRIPVKAKLTCRFSAVAGKLASYPGLKGIKKGAICEYLIDDQGRDRRFTVSFSKNEIIMTIYSSESPQYHMQDALLRMLGILAFMSNHYEIQLKDMYPYLISVIGSHKLGYIFGSAKKICGRANDTDIILARRINALIASNRKLESEIEKLKTKATFILSDYIMTKYTDTDRIDIKELVKDTGFTDNEIMAAIQYIENSGYRKMRLKDGNYSLLSI